MRNLAKVIDQMLIHIPPEEKAFISGLNSDKDSYRYTSPETIVLRWRSVAGTLQYYMGNPPFDEPWKQKVVDIWMDRV